MKRKVFLLSAFLIGILIFTECLLSTDEQVNYAIKDIKLTNLVIDTSFRNFSTISNIDYKIDSVNYYGFRFEITDSEVEKIRLGQLIRDFNIINEAYAFDDYMIFYKLINPIDSIIIRTVNEFDSTHRINSYMNDYFSFRHHGDYKEESILLVLDELMGYLKYYEEVRLNMLGIDFILNNNPILDSILEFKLDIYFRDLSVISKNTVPIVKQ